MMPILAVIINMLLVAGIVIYSYKQGKLAEQRHQKKRIKAAFEQGQMVNHLRKTKAYLQLAPDEFMLEILCDNIENNVFSPEIRRN